MGGGRGGMRGGIDRGGRRMPREIQDKMEALRALPVDQIWSAMSFGIDLPDSQLVVLKPLFTDSWAKRQRKSLEKLIKKQNNVSKMRFR